MHRQVPIFTTLDRVWFQAVAKVTVQVPHFGEETLGRKLRVMHTVCWQYSQHNKLVWAGRSTCNNKR